jgi:hypothetical protein
MDQRLLGQDVTIRLVKDGVVMSDIAAIGSFDDSVDTEVKQEGFLGQTADTFSDVFSGYKGNLEFQTARSGWNEFVAAVVARATRADPGIVFNVIRCDIYPGGDSTVYTYLDVAWGPTASTLASRKDFHKVKMSFSCSERSMTNNQVL